jgi:hypothetical protein
LEILIIQHLRRQSQEQKFSFIPEKRFIKEAGNLRDKYSKMPAKDCLYFNHCGIPWPIFSYPINFLSQEDFKKHRTGP